MTIYHIELGQAGYGLSGGEKCMIELIKFLKKKRNKGSFAPLKNKNVLITTNLAKKTYEKLGLREDDFLRYKTIEVEPSENKFFIFLSYIKRTIKALKLINGIQSNDSDILFCHSDFFPNSIPFYYLAKKNNKTKLFYWFHALAPDIFKGYEGYFTGRFQIPRLNVIHNNLNQWIYKKLTFKRGIILTGNPYFKEILKRRYPKNRIYAIKRFGGLDIERIQIKEVQKKYDLIWMGRFQSLKGLFDTIDIVRECKKRIYDIKLAVLGGGSKKIEEKFEKLIKKNHLEKNIEYKGFIVGDKKYGYLRQSKIFLITSYFESFGVVILEAMTCGLPVVAYNLPVYSVFEKGLIKTSIGDKGKLAEKILSLLENKDYYLKMKNEALDFSKDFSWEKTGEEIYKLVESS